MNYRHAPRLSHPGLQLDRIYLRRLHWHAESEAIRSPALAQPRLNVVLDVQHSPSPRNPYLLEVTLFLNARCDNAEALVFETKMQYTGLYRIDSPELASDKTVIDFCAAQIYPHLRREFANRTLLGGFQGLLLHDRHLETCLHQLFMGPSMPKAGFVRIFGTLFHQRSQPTLPKKARSGPPAQLRIASRRALRSPWLLPALAVPVLTSLLGGVHWWMDHRQPAPANALTTKPAYIAANTPSNSLPAAIDPAVEKSKAAAKRLEVLREIGAEWLGTQPKDYFTVAIVRTKQVDDAVAAADKLTMDQPAFLLSTNGDSVIVTGSFAKKQDATSAADRLKKTHKVLMTSVVAFSSFKAN